MNAWTSLAACAGTDTRIWFGPEDESPDAMAEREACAIAICRPCPVRQPCLEDALSQPSQHGVRGGVGEEQRKALRHALVKRQQREQERAA